jgi:uncharacterized damage-inducible protein DinB
MPAKEEFSVTENSVLVPAILEGWSACQQALDKSLAPLSPEQLALKAAPRLRSVSQIVAHVIGARARWFYLLMGEGGEAFKALGAWDRRGARARSAEELVSGLEATWAGMQEAIQRWTSAEWQQTWPGEDASEPELISRQWVIWHLIEHDLHHGGEVSITLGAHGVQALHL